MLNSRRSNMFHIQANVGCCGNMGGMWTLHKHMLTLETISAINQRTWTDNQTHNNQEKTS